MRDERRRWGDKKRHPSVGREMHGDRISKLPASLLRPPGAILALVEVSVRSKLIHRIKKSRDENSITRDLFSNEERVALN